MPLRGRSILLAAAAVAGTALGAGPALGARHHGARLIATKARAHWHVPARSAGRPPLVGTLPAGTSTTPAWTDPTPTTPAPACPTALGVREGEWFTQPSRSSLCAGRLTVELDNVGMDDHDLEIVDLDTGTVAGTWDIVHPGKHFAQPLTLAPGTYRLFCTLSSEGQTHDALGMNAVVTVG